MCALYDSVENLTKDEYADKWREEYDTTSCSEQVRNISKLQEKYISNPDASSNFREDITIDFFDYVFTKRNKIKVLEFGGGLGHLANHVIKKYGDRIEKWTNYEMQTYSITHNQCKYPQYTSFISTKFFWEYSLTEQYDVFITAHAIEHIKAYQLKMLFDKIRSNVDFIYLESPICDDSNGLTPRDNVNRFFKNCGALHILEIGWKQVIEMLPEFVNLENLNLLYIIQSNPQYPSRSWRGVKVEDRGNNIKIIYYKGKQIVLALPENKGIYIPGRSILRYDAPRSDGGVFCFEKGKLDVSEQQNKEKQKQDFDEFMKSLKNKTEPAFSFVVDVNDRWVEDYKNLQYVKDNFKYK